MLSREKIIEFFEWLSQLYLPEQPRYIYINTEKQAQQTKKQDYR